MTKGDEARRLMASSRQWHEWIIETSGMPRVFYEKMPEARKAIGDMTESVKAYLKRKSIFSRSLFVCTVGGGVLEHAGSLYLQVGPARGNIRFYISDEDGMMVWTSDDNLTSVPACWFLVMRNWKEIERRIDSVDMKWCEEAVDEIRAFAGRLGEAGL